MAEGLQLRTEGFELVWTWVQKTRNDFTWRICCDVWIKSMNHLGITENIPTPHWSPSMSRPPHTHTHLWPPCGWSSGTSSPGWGRGWNVRPPRCWCRLESRWTRRSGSSGTRHPAAAPCPLLWWLGAPRGQAGCCSPGGLASWNTKPVSKKNYKQ